MQRPHLLKEKCNRNADMPKLRIGNKCNRNAKANQCKGDVKEVQKLRNAQGRLNITQKANQYIRSAKEEQKVRNANEIQTKRSAKKCKAKCTESLS